MKYITAEELRVRVRQEAKKYRSNAEFARSIEVWPSFIGNFLSGEKGPGFKLMQRMGVKEVTMYEIVEEKEAATLGGASPPESTGR